MRRSAPPTVRRTNSLIQLFILFTPLIWCVSVFGARQSVSQNPPPPPPPEQNSSAATLRVTSRLVQVEVIVQDKDGNPVPDLAKEDFTIFDKGQPQQIALFRQPSRSVSAAAAQPGIARNVFSNRVETNSAGASSVTVILMDAVNTKFHDLAYVRARVLAFLSELHPDDQVALYLLTPSKLYTLHDFTNDSATLIRMMGMERTDANGGKNQPVDAETKRMNKTISDAFAESNYFYKGGRMGVVENTAQAMNKIAKNVANIPGRKSLVWISGGFPLYIGERAPIGARAERQDFSPLISATAKMLANADVAVYPVDARGLWAPPGGRGYVLPNFDSMIMIANGTGGHAFYNTNDITGSIRKAIDDSVSSYTIAYYPTNNNWDYSFRPISVKTSRKGLQLRYRTGYYAIPDSNDGNGMRDQRISDAIRSPIQMMDLGVEVRVDAAQNSDVREFKVQVRIDPSQMHFQKGSERWTDSVDVVWAGMSADGRVIDKDADRIELHPEQSGYDEIQRNGLSFTEHIRLQNRPTEIRLVVRDAGSGAIGSVNIPVSSLIDKTKLSDPAY